MTEKETLRALTNYKLDDPKGSHLAVEVYMTIELIRHAAREIQRDVERLTGKPWEAAGITACCKHIEGHADRLTKAINEDIAHRMNVHSVEDIKPALDELALL